MLTSATLKGITAKPQKLIVFAGLSLAIVSSIGRAATDQIDCGDPAAYELLTSALGELSDDEFLIARFVIRDPLYRNDSVRYLKAWEKNSSQLGTDNHVYRLFMKFDAFIHNTTDQSARADFMQAILDAGIEPAVPNVLKMRIPAVYELEYEDAKVSINEYFEFFFKQPEPEAFAFLESSVLVNNRFRENPVRYRQNLDNVLVAAEVLGKPEIYSAEDSPARNVARFLNSLSEADLIDLNQSGTLGYNVLKKEEDPFFDMVVSIYSELIEAFGRYSRIVNAYPDISKLSGSKTFAKFLRLLERNGVTPDEGLEVWKLWRHDSGNMAIAINVDGSRQSVIWE